MGDRTRSAGPTRGDYVRSLSVALFLLALGGVASQAGSVFMAMEFPDRPMPRDLLFEVLPYVSWARYVTATGLIAATVLFLWYAVARIPRRIPEVVAVCALMYLLRAALMILTPLADAQGPSRFVFPFVQHGMFPSGHVALLVIFALVVGPQDDPWLHRAEVVLALAVSTAFVVAHGHYSIDVAGGALLGYFVQQEWAAGSLFDPVKRLVGADAAATRGDDT